MSLACLHESVNSKAIKSPLFPLYQRGYLHSIPSFPKGGLGWILFLPLLREGQEACLPAGGFRFVRDDRKLVRCFVTKQAEVTELAMEPWCSGEISRFNLFGHINYFFLGFVYLFLISAGN